MIILIRHQTTANHQLHSVDFTVNNKQTYKNISLNTNMKCATTLSPLNEEEQHSLMSILCLETVTTSPQTRLDNLHTNSYVNLPILPGLKRHFKWSCHQKHETTQLSNLRACQFCLFKSERLSLWNLLWHGITKRERERWRGDGNGGLLSSQVCLCVSFCSIHSNGLLINYSFGTCPQTHLPVLLEGKL